MLGDLAAAFVPFAGVWLALCFLLALCLKRWGCAAGLGLAVLVSASLCSPLRAARGSGPAAFNVLAANVRNGNQEPEGLCEVIVGSGVDMIVLSEISGVTGPAIRRDTRISERYPYLLRVHPGGDAPRLFIMSRWPLEWANEGREGQPERGAGLGTCVVHTPMGPIGLIGMHAPSPRSNAEWLEGNRRAHDAASEAARLHELGLRVVVAGDLNATPAGNRSLVLSREGGVRRAKPFGTWNGTYPDSVPAIVSLPIDFVAVDAAFGVVRWERVGIPGSDHAGVIVGLTVR